MITRKPFQERVLGSLRAFFDSCRITGSPARAFESVVAASSAGYVTYVPPNAVAAELPYVCVRVPTGGGKTLLAAHAFGIAKEHLLQSQFAAALWLVPINTILTQTLKALKDPSHPYRRALSLAGEDVEVLSIEEALQLPVLGDRQQNVVVVATIQSFRVEDTSGRKVYEANGTLATAISALPASLARSLPRRETIEALSQATELDGDFAAPRVDLALALIAEGDPRAAEAVAMVERLPPAGGLAEAQRMLTRIALAYRFPQGEATGQGVQETGVAIWAALTRDSTLLGLPQAGAGPRVLNGLGTPAGALDLGGRYERAGRGRALQRSGLYAQMFALTALGRPLAADSVAARFLEMSPGVQHSAFRRQLAAAVVVLDDGAPPEEVAAVADSLAPMLLPSTASPIRLEAGWLRALAAIRLEDTAWARRVLRDHLGDDPPPRRPARLIVEAALLAAGGDAGASGLVNAGAGGDQFL